MVSRHSNFIYYSEHHIIVVKSLSGKYIIKKVKPSPPVALYEARNSRGA